MKKNRVWKFRKKTWSSMLSIFFLNQIVSFNSKYLSSIQENRLLVFSKYKKYPQLFMLILYCKIQMIYKTYCDPY